MANNLYRPRIAQTQEEVEEVETEGKYETVKSPADQNQSTKR